MSELLTLDRQVCFALYSASRAATAAYRPLLDPLGITYPQYIALLVLWEEADAGHPDVSVSDLGGRLALDSGTMSPLLKRLEAMSLVTRRRSASDERRVTVSLTDAGTALRARAESIPECFFAATGLTVEEAGQLGHLLGRLSGTLRLDEKGTS